MKKSLLIALAIMFAGTSFADIYVGSHHHAPTGETNSRAADCAPANERIFLEFNNIRAVVETAGFLWEDRANEAAAYEYPKGSNSFVLFSGALWMGGEDANGQLKIAAHRYRNDGNDYWAGPLGNLANMSDSYTPFVVQDAGTTITRAHGGAANIDKDECEVRDRFHIIRKKEVLDFIKWWNCVNEVTPSDECEGVIEPDADVLDRIYNWPAHGKEDLGQDRYLAPFYDNALPGETGNGEYNPERDGDYPWYDIEEEVDCRGDRRVTLFGDETFWWVFNDKGNIHTETGGEPIGMEVRAQAFSFATDDEVNNMTFYNYELINRGSQILKNTYFGQYVDPDIGFAHDDYVGCDVERGLGYCYNANPTDAGQGSQTPYGANPPAVGVDFFEGPYQDNDGEDNPIYKTVPDSTEPIALMPEVYAKKGIPYPGLGIGYGDGTPDNERFGMSRFIYYNNSLTANGDPTTSAQHYSYLRGIWRDGTAMTYGGDGIGSGTTDIPTRFMFPGDSDPLGWGTYPTATPGDGNWSELSEDLSAGDRRFIQSSGPFTLRPGAVNNITVGVVIGQSSDTDIEAPIRALKIADTKAQDLFDNCFKVLSPPAAPILTIQEMENELILFLSDAAGTEPIEDYEEEDFRIKTPKELADSGEVWNNKFLFEGFQIFQMVDAVASVADLGDLSKARLVAQTDVINNVGKLVNYTYDEELDISIPSVMVEPKGEFGLDEGIRRSFQITEDQFASENRKLVNHKKYYFLAVSYAYNEYLKYDPNDPTAIIGQKRPYLRSRISGNGGSIKSVVGIPHDPSPEADGRVFTTRYNEQPEITQIEGEGNGAHSLELTDETIKQIMANGRVDHPIYESGAGPIDVKVIDPLVLKGGDYKLAFETVSDTFNSNGWTLIRFADGTSDTVRSEKAISVSREQLILDWGISVRVNQQIYERTASGYMYTEPIEATIEFADSSKNWLSFNYDTDGFYPDNWIRTGSSSFLDDHDDPTTPPNATCIADNWIYAECHYDDVEELDNQNSYYEQLLGGGIAPFRLVGRGVYGSPFGYPEDDGETPWYYSDNESWFTTAPIAQRKAGLEYLHDVDIIITNDQNLWTRCPVIEINNNSNQTENGEFMLEPRRDPSVDKQGRSKGEAGYIAEEGDLVNEFGMGWFPGYAIDVNTGTRLNMIFSENSWLQGDNGDDMLWNPTSNARDASNSPLFGGMHYVYVFGEDVDGNDCPSYDNGEWLRDKLDLDKTNSKKNTDYLKAWANCFWVMEPMLEDRHELLETDVKIRARVKKPYAKRDVNGENLGYPLYQFSFENPSIVEDGNRLLSVLDRINVVPNPYYAYSEYEENKRDNRVKITNLPERCEVNIFNMQGALIRSFKKDDPLTSIDWDLRNHQSIPIAGGLYIIHITVEIPDENGNVIEHEKILKWYGALRQPDLDNL